MNTEASHLNTVTLDYGGNYTKDRIESNLEWWDEQDQIWRSMMDAYQLELEDELRTREANQILDLEYAHRVATRHQSKKGF